MSLWTLTSFSQGLFSSFSGRKARCLSASFSASEATLRVTQTCLSRRRWQWEKVRGRVSGTGWVGGACGSGGKRADGAVTTVPDLRFRRKGNSHLRPSSDLRSLGRPLFPRRCLPYIYHEG